MKSSVIALVLAVLASAQAASVNISEIVDLKLQLANKLSVTGNRSVTDYGSGFLNAVTYEGAVGIGLDSLKRTGDCQMKFDGEKITYIYKIGQNILATFFRKVSYKDVAGSGYYKILNNSIDYAYTVSYEGASCSVRLETLALTVGDVEAYIQDKSWDTRNDAEFKVFVQQQIVPAFNNKLRGRTSSIQTALESIFCEKAHSGEQYTAGIDVLRTFLFE